MKRIYFLSLMLLALGMSFGITSCQKDKVDPTPDDPTPSGTTVKDAICVLGEDYYTFEYKTDELKDADASVTLTADATSAYSSGYFTLTCSEEFSKAFVTMTDKVGHLDVSYCKDDSKTADPALEHDMAIVLTGTSEVTALVSVMTKSGKMSKPVSITIKPVNKDEVITVPDTLSEKILMTDEIYWSSALVTQITRPISSIDDEKATLTADKSAIDSGKAIMLTCSEECDMLYISVEDMVGCYKSVYTNFLTDRTKTKRAIRLHNMTDKAKKVKIVGLTTSGKLTNDLEIVVGAYQAQVTKIGFNYTGITTSIGEEYHVTADVYPTTAANKNLTWASSDESVATVDQNGNVKTVGEGKATITAKAADGYGAEGSMWIAVNTPKITDLSLNPSSVTLKEGDTKFLSPQWMPSTITDPGFEWTSSDKSVARVDRHGFVTGQSEGTATITCTAKDGSGLKATCEVTVTSCHDYVDLGLTSGTLWATTNVGRNVEYLQDKGSYHAWGDIQASSDDKFSGNMYNTWSLYTFSDRCIDYMNSIIYPMWRYTFVDSPSYSRKPDYLDELLSVDDPATCYWGKHWCSPSEDQFKELKDECKWEWMNWNGTEGYMVKSKVNSNWIFLPAAGNLGYKKASEKGCYWTRNLKTDSYFSQYAICFYFSKGSKEISNNYRCYAFSIRPVRKY